MSASPFPPPPANSQCQFRNEAAISIKQCSPSLHFFPPPNGTILIPYALNVSLNFSNRHELVGSFSPRHYGYGRERDSTPACWKKAEQIMKNRKREHVPNTFYPPPNFFFASTFPDFLARLLYDRRFRSNLTKIEFYALKYFPLAS